MPDLAAGSQVYGDDFPPSASDLDFTTQPNIGSTAYQIGDPEVAVTVTAPTSGRVLVCISAGIRNNGTNADRGTVAYAVLEDGSNGPVVTPPSGSRAVVSIGVGHEEYRYVGNYALEDGLEPGKAYYFQVQHRASIGGSPSGTVDIASRIISVIPMP